MGLLDSLLSAVLKGGLGQAQNTALPDLLSQILGKTDLGSLGGMLKQLQQGGLDRQVASWLGQGTNMPISPDQLRSALGNRTVQQMGQVSGISIKDLLNTLSQNLPQTIDTVSPNGSLEEQMPQSSGSSAGGSGGSLQDQAGLRDIKSRY